MDLDLDAPSTSLNTNASSLIEAEFRDVEDDNNSSSLSNKKGKQKQIDSNEDIVQEEGQDWEWVEETEYIVLDFGGSNIDAKDMEEMATDGYSLIGLDTPTPYFKAGIHTFKGFFEENAITEDLIFEMKAREEIEETMDDSDEENNPDSLDLVSIVTKRVLFEPVELFPKTQFESMPDMTAKPNISAEVTAEMAAENSSASRSRRNAKISIWKAAYDAVGIKSRNRSRKNKESQSTSIDAEESSQATTSSSQVLDQSTSINTDGDEREEIRDVEME
ncbi:hypothetical protein BGZ76_010870 [Entomortierella beljakovae]|nr:hypothetical protein BGZ76_010870 [Entomortierella beljakovae]